MCENLKSSNSLKKKIFQCSLQVAQPICIRREEMKVMLKDLYHRYPTVKDNLLTMLSNYEKEVLWGNEIFIK